MKKTLFFSLLISFAFFSQAQISLIYNGANLSDGDTVHLQTNDREVAFQPTIVNSGSTDRVCIMKGSWSVSPEDVVVSMCAGIHCNTGLKSSPFKVTANSEYGDGHVEFYFPSGSTTCLLKFSVYDTAETSVRTEVYLYIDEPVNINAVTESDKLCAFPNPSSNFVTIRYTLKYDEGAIILYNMSGTKVSETPVNGNEGTIRIDVSKLPTGVYMYGIRDRKRISTMHKLVVK